MKITINHKCGHARDYDLETDVEKRKLMLSDFACPSCAAREFAVKRMESRIEDAFNRKESE